MIRRPPRSTPKPSSAASDVYKRQVLGWVTPWEVLVLHPFLRAAPPGCQVFLLLVFFSPPSRTPLSQNGPRDPMSDSGRMGPTGPPNAAADGKRPRNAPEMADFGGRDGAQRGEAQLSTSWSSERASRAYAARRVTPPVRKVRPSVSFDVPSGSPPAA